MKIGGFKSSAAVAAVTVCGVADIAVAQTANPALPTREQIDIPNIDQVPSGAQVSVSNQTSPTKSCPFQNSKLVVTLDRVDFVQPNGAPLPEAIRSSLANLTPEKSEKSIASLCDLRDQAAEQLSDAGYIAAVTIPTQDILAETRSASLMVILGKLVEVTTTGDAGGQANVLARRLQRLKDVSPLRTSELERELLLASDNPALDVKMVLRSANTVPGEIIGVVSVSQKPFSVVANLQNHGSRTIGRETASVRAEYYGLLGWEDVTFIGASTTLDFDEQQSVQGGYYLTLPNDLRIGGALTYGWSKPDLGPLDFRTKSLIGAIDIRYPLVRTVEVSLLLGGGVEFIEQEAILRAGTTALPLTRDKLRIAYLSLSGEASKPLPGGREAWSVAGNLSFRQGLNILDASTRGTFDSDGFFPSRSDGNPQASVLRAGLTSRFWPSRTFSISTSIQAQVSSAPLLAFEEFTVGNLTLGRGYDPGATAGDNAIGARLEPAIWLPIRKSGFAVQAFAFGDIVRIWNKDTITTEDGRSLRSVGGGLRAFFSDRFLLGITYAHPLDPELNFSGAADAPDRVLVSLTFDFGAR